ncbi:MAG: hypothetical protein GWP08_13890 [Nitrospiraceae bacterium]|nr:hypothetical protein [Nitrospiraceae bacterium]
MSQTKVQYHAELDRYITHVCRWECNRYEVFTPHIWSRHKSADITRARHAVILHLAKTISSADGEWRIEDNHIGTQAHRCSLPDDEADQFHWNPISMTKLGYLLGLDHSTISLAMRGAKGKRHAGNGQPQALPVDPCDRSAVHGNRGVAGPDAGAAGPDERDHTMNEQPLTDTDHDAIPDRH